MLLGKKFNHTYMKICLQKTCLNEDFSELVDIIKSFKMDAGIYSGIIC
jgi:hypothetical protein